MKHSRIAQQLLWMATARDFFFYGASREWSRWKQYKDPEAFLPKEKNCHEPSTLNTNAFFFFRNKDALSRQLGAHFSDLK